MVYSRIWRETDDSRFSITLICIQIVRILSLASRGALPDNTKYHGFIYEHLSQEFKTKPNQLYSESEQMRSLELWKKTDLEVWMRSCTCCNFLGSSCPAPDFTLAPPSVKVKSNEDQENQRPVDCVINFCHYLENGNAKSAK